MDTNDFQVFSLEEDDCSDLFVTQTPRKKNIVPPSEENCNESQEGNEFRGVDQHDFMSPCVSLHSKLENTSTVYSAISDPEDDFEKPIYGSNKR